MSIKNRNSTEGYYVESCPVCAENIARSADTDNQLGRCRGCGFHDNDSDFMCDPTKELDFNE